MLRPDILAPALDEGPLDDILQLADVAGLVVAAQRLHGLGTQHGGVETHLSGKPRRIL